MSLAGQGAAGDNGSNRRKNERRLSHPCTKPTWIQRLQDSKAERWWPKAEPEPDESQDGGATINWILHAFADLVMTNIPDDAPLEVKWQIEGARRDTRLAKQLLMEAIAFGQVPFIAQMIEVERGR